VRLGSVPSEEVASAPLLHWADEARAGGPLAPRAEARDIAGTHLEER
jgi:hypothetical protein